jgi:hypothetical protein
MSPSLASFSTLCTLIYRRREAHILQGTLICQPNVLLHRTSQALTVQDAELKSSSVCLLQLVDKQWLAGYTDRWPWPVWSLPGS